VFFKQALRKKAKNVQGELEDPKVQMKIMRETFASMVKRIK
jgi:hypothetical protein